ncbi:hypothetical protein [Saccharothrix stipae]
MKRAFSTVEGMNAHFDAQDRIPGMHDDYVEALHALNNHRADGLATRADYERVAELTGELARLHSAEADYYTRLTATYAELAAETSEDEG